MREVARKLNINAPVAYIKKFHRTLSVTKEIKLGLDEAACLSQITLSAPNREKPRKKPIQMGNLN
jgi:hypothetical protein